MEKSENVEAKCHDMPHLFYFPWVLWTRICNSLAFALSWCQFSQHGKNYGNENVFHFHFLHFLRNLEMIAWVTFSSSFPMLFFSHWVDYLSLLRDFLFDCVSWIVSHWKLKTSSRSNFKLFCLSIFSRWEIFFLDIFYVLQFFFPLMADFWLEF